MIRKTIIVVLTVAATGTGVLTVIILQADQFAVRPPLRWELYQSQRRLIGIYIATAHARILIGEVSEHPFPERTGRVPDRMRGFYYRRKVDGALGYRTWWIGFPMWVPLTLFAAYPTLACIGWALRGYRRRRRGLCVKCGYNLTGNVSGVCPECGAEVKRP
jgi:hypothetical protein